MEQTDQTTGITNSLLVPDDLFIWAMTLIFRLVLVFLYSKLFVCLTDGEDEE